MIDILPKIKTKFLFRVVLFLAIFFIVTIIYPTFNHCSISIAQENIAQKSMENMEKTAIKFYQNGEFAKAIKWWEQAAQSHTKQGNIIRQAQILNYLSTAYQALGKWENAKKTIATSLKILENYRILDKQKTVILAQALNTLAHLQLSIGNTETAIETWQKAETAYTQADNIQGELGSQINQAQALKILGNYRRSREILQQVNQKLQAMPDSVIKADSLRSLGVALQLIGDLIESKAILEKSWAIAQKLDSPVTTSATIFSIGNFARDLNQPDVALDYYQEAAPWGVKAGNSLVHLQILLNQLRVAVAEKQWQMGRSLLPKITYLLDILPPSRNTIYAKINFAETLMQIAQEQNQQPTNSDVATIKISSQDTATLIKITVEQAKQIQDPQAEAYAINQLGHLYEQQQQWQPSEALTQKALKISQTIGVQDLIARTSWQIGRIFCEQGKTREAINAYQTAYNALKLLRNDIVAVNPEVQLEFKESIEPIYRQFINLLLKNTPNTPAEKNYVGQSQINKALKAFESLQLAELDNFFREVGLAVKPVQLDKIDNKAAVIYPIILSDRLEVILSVPNLPLRHYSTPIPQAEVESTLQKLYSAYYVGFSQTERLRLSQEVYKWLIQPAETDLAANNIQTLVFVLDGYLRNIPMASLHDGQEYLIENYSIALSLGLQLLPVPEGIQSQQIKALMLGLTEARQGFSPLPGVEIEVEGIAQEIDSEIVLLDKKFTRLAFEKQIEVKPFSVVHLATHGQFSSNPEETFLLTWDSRIQVNELGRILQEQNRDPIELLVLSACQTATGDNRAALGLAGLASRSGARSTLATLWSVDDLSTAELMIDFYRLLIANSEPRLTKAEALRQAQLTLMQNPKYDHPYFWAPFVLVGNWL
ncbi:MAG: CHAT domain-containing protein [Microcoleaceae cyanobacterium MO_207.B10]|nr:CHAT domain-containing protein [Microcoleaceae cyanobacterium MO_207.B10]